MVWVAVDENGDEYKFSVKPAKYYNGVLSLWSTRGRGMKIKLPKSSIKKLVGRELTWDDEPVELKE